MRAVARIWERSPVRLGHWLGRRPCRVDSVVESDLYRMFCIGPESAYTSRNLEADRPIHVVRAEKCHGDIEEVQGDDGKRYGSKVV